MNYKSELGQKLECDNRRGRGEREAEANGMISSITFMYM